MGNYVFLGLTETSPLGDLCAAARIAGHKAAASDLKQPAVREAVARLGVDGFLTDPDSRPVFEDWLLAHSFDKEIVDSLPAASRAAVLDAAWESYAATVREAAVAPPQQSAVDSTTASLRAIADAAWARADAAATALRVAERAAKSAQREAEHAEAAAREAVAKERAQAYIAATFPRAGARGYAT